MGGNWTHSSGKRQAQMAALAAFLCLLFPALAGAGTTISNIRLGNHSDYTRLVFDSEGDRPESVGVPTDGGLTIRYGELKTGSILPRKYNSASSAVTGIVLKNANEILVSFRGGNATVKSAFMEAEPPRPGRYRLILDVSLKPGQPSEPTGTPAEPAAKPVEKAPKEAGKEKKPAPAKEPPPPPAPAADTKEPARPSKSQKTAGAVSSPTSTKPGAPGKGETPPQKQPGDSAPPDAVDAGPLYEMADSYFDVHQNTLAQDGNQVLEYYTAALKANPRHPNAPRALFRCGLATLAGNPIRAEKYFQQVIAGWPNNPVAIQCWMNLGKIYHQRESYIEAIEAFRAALRAPVSKSEKTEAGYNLGRELSIVGAHKEAIESLNQCLTDDPGFYLKRPDLFKYLGESTFTLQQYDRSRDLLMRYLNLKEDYPDRDLILAKIAEIFLHQGEQALANKLYNYIQNHYRDTEGDYISRIRKAELLEKRERGGLAGALTIYEELYQKNLPPALGRLVAFKLASAEWKRGESERSLSLIETALKNKMDPNSQSEFNSLRDKVVLDFFKKAYSSQNHTQVVELYEKYPNLFQSLQSPELEADAAESYSALKLYPSAVRIYERLLSGAKKKNEDWLMKTAQYCFLMGDLDKSGQYCRLVQSDTYDTQKTLLSGRIAYLQGKHAEAVKILNKLVLKQLDSDPSDPEPVLIYIKSLVELKRFDEALPLARKFLDKQGEGDPELRLQIGFLLIKCYQETNQPEKAIELMDSLLAIAPTDNQKDQLRYEMARLYLSLGQKDKAVERLNELLQSSQSLWKIAAQQQLDSMNMARP